MEACGRETRLVLSGETLICKHKISEIEKLLPGDVFVQCHRGILVNLAWTKQIRPYEFELRSGLVIPIGRPRYAEVYKTFFKYIME